MKLQFFILLLTVFLLVLPITAQKKSQTSDVPTVDFCDLVNQPSTYDKKIVRTKAIYVTGYHGSYIYDFRCDNGDGSMEAGYEKSKIFKTEKTVNKKYDKILNAESESNSNRAYVTVIGRFNDWNGFGYGHLNWSRFEFAVMAYESIETVPSSTTRNSKKSNFMSEVEYLRQSNSTWSSTYLGFYVENADDIFAVNYIFINLDGKKFDKSQFSEIARNNRNIVAKKTEEIPGKKSAKGNFWRAERSRKVFIEDNKAIIKESDSITYICPNDIIFQYQYANYFEKQDGKWKLVRTQLTSNKSSIDKSSIELSCY